MADTENRLVFKADNLPKVVAGILLGLLLLIALGLSWWRTGSFVLGEREFAGLAVGAACFGYLWVFHGSLNVVVDDQKIVSYSIWGRKELYWREIKQLRLSVLSATPHGLSAAVRHCILEGHGVRLALHRCTIRNYPLLLDRVYTQTCARLLSQAEKQMAGPAQQADFGPLALTPQGLVDQKRGKNLSWSDLRSISAGPELLYVTGAGDYRHSFPLMDIPNLHIMAIILERKVPGLVAKEA